MLSNADFLAKFRFDTAENEPAKNLQKKSANFPISATARLPRRSRPTRTTRRAARFAEPDRRHRSATRRPIGKISAKCCSFSAVSAPIFASKYAFCSIFQNLPDYLADNFEIWQTFAVLKHLQKIAEFSRKLLFFKLICC